MKRTSLTVGPLAVNCYLVADENGNAAVIDPGDEASRILEALQREGMTCKAVLLTHVHFDHIGAVKELCEATGAPLYCHEDDAAALTDGRRNLAALFGVALSVPSEAETLRDGQTLAVGDLRFEVLHTPGHTPGGVCYRIGDTLFSGDTLFCESVGRIDFPGGDGGALRRSIARLFTLPDETRVFPGHDEPTSIGHEKQYNPYV